MYANLLPLLPVIGLFGVYVIIVFNISVVLLRTLFRYDFLFKRLKVQKGPFIQKVVKTILSF